MNDLNRALLIERFTPHVRTEEAELDNDMTCGRRRQALLEAISDDGEAAA